MSAKIKKTIEKIEIKRLRNSLFPFSKGGIPLRKMGRGICCLLFTIYYLPFTVFAGGTGTSGAQFLKIGIGARAVAMGEAYAGMEGDINSIYWNPAGLARVGTSQTSFAHTAWFQSINYENLMAGFPAGSGFMALGINWLTVGSIDKYTNYTTGGQPTPAGESYSPVDMSAVVSYSREVKGIPFGTNLKYISSNIDGETASSLALDIGAMYRLGKLNTGLAIQNLGAGLKFRSESDPLPLNIKLGGVYKFGRRLTAALDFNVPNDSDFRVNTGVEYSRKYGEKLTLALRTGYKTNTKGLDAVDGLSFGFGVGYKSSRLDYAWVPYGDLGTAHRISFVYRMGAVEGPRTYERAEKVKVKPEEAPVESLDDEIKRLEQELFKKEPEKKPEKRKKKKKKKEVKKQPEIPMEDVEDLDEEIKRLEQSLLKTEEPEKKKEEKKKEPLSPAEKKKLMGKHFNKATQLYKQEKYKEAIAEWEEVLKLDPGHSLSKIKISKAEEQLKK